jgi:hypothetical protein
VQDNLLIPHHKGMPGIVTPLVANNVIGIFGIDINYLAFAFVPPLGSDYHYISHYCLLVICAALSALECISLIWAGC